MEQYFPKGIAKDKSFFNRTNEVKRLIGNIEKGEHTLILSPRRYGKSSLAKHVIKRVNYPYCDADFFLALDGKSIEHKLLKGVRDLIQQVSDTPEQWFKILRNYFNRLNKKWTIGIQGFYLELEPNDHSSIAENILDALNALEYILKKQNKKAILFIDEFQEIIKIKEGLAIEGAIRHFAQESKHLVFIFSGSNRHMLQSMFGDRTRPLYNLCDRLNLDRISSNYYKKYLDYVSQKTWGEPIKRAFFDKIMEITETHPNCVYILCGYIWREYPDKHPSINQVEKCWDQYITDINKETREELSSLSVGQLKLLAMIANGKVRELTGKAVQKKLNLSGSAITQALKVLENADHIERLENKSYRIINPIIKSTMHKYYTEYIV